MTPYRLDGPAWRRCLGHSAHVLWIMAVLLVSATPIHTWWVVGLLVLIAGVLSAVWDLVAWDAVVSDHVSRGRP